MNTILTATIVAACLLVAAGCARSWPDEIPDHDEWQIRSAPMLEVRSTHDTNKTHGDGVMVAAFVYASNWTDHLRQRDDPSFAYAVLPSRLDVVCIDVTNTHRGVIDIMIRLSDNILSRWHPQNWESVNLTIHDKESKSDTIPMQIRGYMPYVDGSDAVADALAELKRYASRPESYVDMTALFDDENLPPLKVSFPIGIEANGDALQLLYERCGELW